MREKSAAVWLPLLLFTTLWGDLTRQLAFHWSTNPQYAYGWSVPVLALFLFWEAWLSRPDPGSAPGPAVPIILMGICALCMLPARLFFEATPDWRLPLWVDALAVIGLTLCWIWLGGGAAWAWHFAFPTAFMLVAVPWPVKLEHPVINALTQGVTALTVHGLNVCGIAAVCHGNLIEISRGVVGIEEACSGIRSFQSVLMAALFLGQLFAFRWPRRILLIVVGALFAFGCNVFRAGMLTAIAEQKGINELEKWHDPAGYGILFISFAALAAFAMWMKPRISLAPQNRAGPMLRPQPMGLTLSLAAWIVFAFAGTEAWYRSGTHIPAPWWTVNWPSEKSGYSDISLTGQMTFLMADKAAGARWWEPDGRQFTMYCIRWLPGPLTSRMLARFHQPEICLPSAGMTLVREAEPEILDSAGFQLPFRMYLFTQSGIPVHVFFCVWEDEKEPAEGQLAAKAWNPESRLRAVLLRRRRLGQQVLEVGIAGEATDAEARSQFQQVIAPLIRADTGA
jgi:exosortase